MSRVQLMRQSMECLQRSEQGLQPSVTFYARSKFFYTFLELLKLCFWREVVWHHDIVAIGIGSPLFKKCFNYLYTFFGDLRRGLWLWLLCISTTKVLELIRFSLGKLPRMNLDISTILDWTTHLDHVLRKISQLRNMNAETLIGDAWQDVNPANFPFRIETLTRLDFIQKCYVTVLCNITSFGNMSHDV